MRETGHMPEPLDNAFEPLDALPIIGKRQLACSGSEPMNSFRNAGFGKTRRDLLKKKERGEGESSDGAAEDGKKKCQHAVIKNFQCVSCSFTLPKFGSFFDSGTINQYMRILPASDSEECVESLGKDVDVIYESYSPRNLIEMRDFMQSVIGKSLISHIKGKNV